MQWNSRYHPDFTVMTDPISPPMVVLVVEDEPLLRMMAVDALAEEGFKTMEAGSATEALTLCNARPKAVDVLFTDIRMPGSMDGLELAHKIHERWPWITILIASGNIFLNHEELPDGAKFFPKPYDMRRVIGAVRELAAASVH
jgi:CheY-like chemotaxis protein